MLRGAVLLYLLLWAPRCCACMPPKAAPPAKSLRHTRYRLVYGCEHGGACLPLFHQRLSPSTPVLPAMSVIISTMFRCHESCHFFSPLPTFLPIKTSRGDSACLHPDRSCHRRLVFAGLLYRDAYVTSDRCSPVPLLGVGSRASGRRPFPACYTEGLARRCDPSLPDVRILPVTFFVRVQVRGCFAASQRDGQ